MKTGADTGPCPGCGEPRGGRYHHRGRWLCWECMGQHIPALKRPERAKPYKPTRYEAMVNKVWTRLEKLTKSRVFYLGPDLGLAAYCPSCCEGTVRIRFLERHTKVVAVVARGHCSRGCTEDEIAEALA